MPRSNATVTLPENTSNNTFTFNLGEEKVAVDGVIVRSINSTENSTERSQRIKQLMGYLYNKFKSEILIIGFRNLSNEGEKDDGSFLKEIAERIDWIHYDPLWESNDVLSIDNYRKLCLMIRGALIEGMPIVIYGDFRHHHHMITALVTLKLSELVAEAFQENPDIAFVDPPSALSLSENNEVSLAQKAINDVLKEFPLADAEQFIKPLTEYEAFLRQQLVIPHKYRVNEFFLFDKEISVTGMAGPHYRYDKDRASDESIACKLDYLVQEGVDVLICLNEEKKNIFTEEAEKKGLKYHPIPVTDYTQISCEVYDKIYAILEEATAEGKKVAIHCGAGDGRTGTALVSLKLRELLSSEFRSNSENFIKQPDKTEKVKVKKESVRCTPLVAEAVRLIRDECIKGDGRDSVESSEDLYALMQYEAHVREQLIQLGKGNISNSAGSAVSTNAVSVAKSSFITNKPAKVDSSDDVTESPQERTTRGPGGS